MIDWEAAKSGKRPVRIAGCEINYLDARYLGPIKGSRHVVVVTDISGNEHVVTYRDNQTCLGNGPHLVQDPEVIEFKRWVNVSQHYVEGLFHDLRSAAWSASASCLANVLVTIRITGDKVEIFGGTE